MKKLNDFLQFIFNKLKFHLHKYRYIYGIIFTISLLVISLLIPFIINEAYKKNEGYLTLWEAKDV